MGIVPLSPLPPPPDFVAVPDKKIQMVELHNRYEKGPLLGMRLRVGHLLDKDHLIFCSVGIEMAKHHVHMILKDAVSNQTLRTHHKKKVSFNTEVGIGYEYHLSKGRLGANFSVVSPFKETAFPSISPASLESKEFRARLTYTIPFSTCKNLLGYNTN